MGRPLAVVGAAVAVVALGLPLATWVWLQVDGRTLTGLRVASERLAPTATPANDLAPRADLWLDARMAARAGEAVVVGTRREMGARIDLDALAARLLAEGHSGAPLADLAALMRAREGAVDLPWPTRVEGAALDRWLARVRAEVERPPIDPSVDAAGRYLPGRDGRALDLAQARALLRRELIGEAVVVTLPVTVRPAASPPERGPASFDAVLSSYTTRFARAGSERNRARNVRRGAELLDGAILAPGEVFSFNGRVGERTLGHGFHLAPEIVDARMVDGVGGGICQVASTLHAAIFLAGLEIIEQTPHSRPSHYIPPGLDATVAWPSVDLQLRNPFPRPVLVRATVSGGRLRVDVLGEETGWRVSHRRTVLSRADFEEQVELDPTLPPGTRQVEEEGIPGFLLRRVRTVESPGGTWSEERLLRYPPTDRIVRVGPEAPAAAEAPAEPASPRAWVEDWLPRVTPPAAPPLEVPL